MLKYSVVYNQNTGVLHVKHRIFGEELTACGHIWTKFLARTEGRTAAKEITCKNCLRSLQLPKFKLPETPKVTVDGIIQVGSNIVLIKRKNPPLGHAFPGGFVDIGESCEAAVVREMKEEVSLDTAVVGLLGVYSDPQRDIRNDENNQIMSIAYVLTADGVPKAADDAKDAFLVSATEAMHMPLIADHGQMIVDFYYKFWHGRENI